MKKKITALLMALIMALGTPVMSFATDGSGTAADANTTEAVQPETEEAELVYDTYIVKKKCLYTKANTVLALVNQERQKRGLPSLKMDKELQSAAMQRAMELLFVYDHYRPDDSSCMTVSKKAVAENIACGQGTPALVMKSWMSSDGHRGNILDEEYDILGVGCVEINGTLHWVQLFGDEFDEAGEPRDSSVVSGDGVISNKDRTEKKSIRVDVDVYEFYVGVADPVALATGEKIRFTYKTSVGSLFSGLEKLKLAPETFTWSSSDASVVTVNSKGRVTALKPGTAKIRVTLPETGRYDEIRIKVADAPKKIKGLKVTKGTNSMTVKWKRDKKATGYQIIYAADKKFKKGKKTITVKNNKTVKKTIGNLKSGKTYYVKVRAYKKISNAKVVRDPVIERIVGPSDVLLKRNVNGAYSKMKKVRVR